jgi:hypothetical protein
MIERKEIVNVSIEGEWSHGIPGHGLVLTGLGWLTKDTKLPGSNVDDVHVRLQDCLLLIMLFNPNSFWQVFEVLVACQNFRF